MGLQTQSYGIQGMLKEGHRHLSGLDEAVIKNIDACKQLSTSLGQNGMNKMVINHLDKLFVTSDTATIVNELEVQHPAAKLLVLAGKAQAILKSPSSYGCLLHFAKHDLSVKQTFSIMSSN